eukprot:Rmarinus@m.23354
MSYRKSHQALPSVPRNATSDSGAAGVHRWREIQYVKKECNPTARGYHTAVHRDGCIYIFGGQHDSQLFNTLFEFDYGKNQWSRVEGIEGTPPTSRINHTAVLRGSCMYIFGGADATHDYEVNDFYEFNFETRVWTAVKCTEDPPCPRSSHTAVLNDDKMYVFGGSETEDFIGFDDLFEFDFESKIWKKIIYTGSGPCPRSIHTTVVYDNRMYVFGGFGRPRTVQGGEGQYFNDLYEYSFLNKQWTQIEATGDPPSPRTEHTAVVHNELGCMYVFGGFDGASVFRDLYEYNFEHKHWKKLDCGKHIPRERGGHTAVVHNDCMYIFGGLIGDTYYADLWEFRLRAAAVVDVPCPVGGDLEQLVNNEIFSDVTLIVEGQKIYAHKNVLYIRSNFFRSLLMSGMKESAEPEIVLHDVRYPVMMALLKYLYTNSIDVDSRSLDVTVDLLAAADQYAITTLVERCALQLEREMNVENTCYILEAADRHSVASLKVVCLDFIRNNFSLVKRTDGFKNLIKQESRDLVLEILSDEQESNSTKLKGSAALKHSAARTKRPRLSNP